jgi:hypothetical protein
MLTLAGAIARRGLQCARPVMIAGSERVLPSSVCDTASKCQKLSAMRQGVPLRAAIGWLQQTNALEPPKRTLD